MGATKIYPHRGNEPKCNLRRHTFDWGDFRGPGDQTSAAKRSYSAWTALCFQEGLFQEGPFFRRGLGPGSLSGEQCPLYFFLFSAARNRPETWLK